MMRRPLALRSLIVRTASLVTAVLLLSAVPARRATGQDPAPAAGTPSGALRVYVGMWSTHFRDLNRGLRNNWLVGFGWRGMYGGTFTNSFGNRSFTAGIQRTVARGHDATVVPSVGFRVGLVSGYDKRFISIASRTPVLPMAQIVGDLETGPTGVELGWAVLVATLGPYFRF